MPAGNCGATESGRGARGLCMRTTQFCALARQLAAGRDGPDGTPGDGHAGAGRGDGEPCSQRKSGLPLLPRANGAGTDRRGTIPTQVAGRRNAANHGNLGSRGHADWQGRLHDHGPPAHQRLALRAVRQNSRRRTDLGCVAKPEALARESHNSASYRPLLSLTRRANTAGCTTAPRGRPQCRFFCPRHRIGRRS